MAGTRGKLPAGWGGGQARPTRLLHGDGAGILRIAASRKSGNRAMRAGRNMFRIGERRDTVYFLAEGWAFLYNISKNGRRQILHFALPGDVLGFHPAGGDVTSYGAQALTDIVVSTIPHKTLEHLAIEFPEVGMTLARMMSRDRDLAYGHLTNIGRRTARERVANLILELYVRYGSQWPGACATEMHLPLTQEHVGDATGLTSVHVNRVLRGLRQEKIVEFHYRRLRILDPDRLVDAASVDPQVMRSWARR